MTVSRLLVLLVLAFLCPSPAAAAPPSREQAIAILSRTDTFADTYVGFVGGASREACAFRTLIDQPDADRLFKGLLGEAHLAGRLYALCGLYFTDPPRFKKEIQPYRTSRDSVATFAGCIMGRQPIAKLVESSSPRVIRLADPSQTTEEWVARHIGPDGSRDYSLDIIGGGWPARFKEMKGCDR
jgi:hypothetical protein